MTFSQSRTSMTRRPGSWATKEWISLPVTSAGRIQWPKEQEGRSVKGDTRLSSVCGHGQDMYTHFSSFLSVHASWLNQLYFHDYCSKWSLPGSNSLSPVQMYFQANQETPHNTREWRITVLTLILICTQAYKQIPFMIYSWTFCELYVLNWDSFFNCRVCAC